MKGVKIFFILLGIIAAVHCSSCPCDEGTNAILKIVENLIVYFNRALYWFRPGNIDQFLKYFENFKKILVQIGTAPVLGTPGSFFALPQFKQCISYLYTYVVEMQESIGNGTDFATAFSEYCIANRDYLFELVEEYKENILPLVPADTPAAVVNLNNAILDFWTELANLCQGSLDLIEQGDVDGSILYFLRTFRQITITLVGFVRAACPGCLIPCC